MSLSDLLQSLGEGEDAQAVKLEAVLKAAAEAQELSIKTQSLTGSVEKLEAKRDELLAEKKRLSRAAKLLAEAGVDFDDENAEALLRAKLAAKGENSSENSLEVIEMKSSLGRLNTLVAELKTRAEKAEEEKEQLKAKKVKADIKQAVLTQLDNATAGVCLSKSRLFQLNENSFVQADDGVTVLWQDGDELKTIDDFAAASAANPEDAIFWAGRGSSGSGTPPGRPGSAAPTSSGTSNPFAVGGNATTAAAMLKSDPRTAERLIAEARSKGKLAPAMARMLEMRK